MADQKITDFPVLSQGGVDVLNDVIPIVDVNLDLNKKITPASIVGAVLPSPGPIGASTPNTGAFTNITIDNLTVLAAGTANGVAYLNGSKVLTTGTGLTFDGNNLLLGQTSNPSSYRLAVTGTVGMTGDFAHFLDGAYSGYVGKASALVSGGAVSDTALRSDANLVLAAGGPTAIATVSSSGLALTGIQTIIANSASAALDVVQNGAGIGTRVRPGTDQTLALVVDKSGSTASRMRMFVGTGSGGYAADEGYFWLNNADIHFRTGVGGTTEALAMKTTGVLNVPNMPTSSAGLVAGDLWSDGGTIKIV